MSRVLIPLLVVVLAGCGGGDAPTPPTGGKAAAAKASPVREYIEAISWTHRDLQKYLASRGVHVEMEANPDPRADTSRGVVANFREGQDTVLVHLKPEAREANELAATWGEDGFQWSRFCFINTSFGTHRLLGRIRDVLTTGRTDSQPSRPPADDPAARSGETRIVP